MKRFQPGDYVIRTTEDWRDCIVGETYEVVGIIDYGSDILYTLRLRGLPAKYDANYFTLSPITNSPLMKALK